MMQEKHLADQETIAEIDGKIIELVKERMQIMAEEARYKNKNDIPLADNKRERYWRSCMLEKADEEYEDYALVLHETISGLTKAYQAKILGQTSQSYKEILRAIEQTPKMFPQKAKVACQGVEGAYSQLAAQKLFAYPDIVHYQTFEAVFEAVEKGECRYGVLPIENSTAGSVMKVYELMVEHKFSIVRAIRLKVDHNLLVKKGVKLDDVCEIFSHEQAINQSGEFLRSLPNIKVTACANTAMAAQMVAQSNRRDIGALSSRVCAENYGLDILKQAVQDVGNNYTRFICISKDLEIYPGADKMSVMLVLKHKPGALYQVLARLAALNINLTKLESRPIAERDFEFMFYFDLEASVYSEKIAQLLADLECETEIFSYLGSYTEIL